MTRSTARRARLGGLLAVALGALALLALPGVAAAKDRNHDHIPDRWEKHFHLSLKVNQAQRDQDHDRLSNLAEFRTGDNPRKRDSNGDGVIDGKENAGTIVSYDAESGELTINLFGGKTISGIVTEETEIECGCNHGEEASGEEEAGTSSSDGSQESGTSGQGDDENDDPPGHDEGSPGTDDGSEHSASCTTEDLVEGATVKEAELELENGVATFSKVALGRDS